MNANIIHIQQGPNDKNGYRIETMISLSIIYRKELYPI